MPIVSETAAALLVALGAALAAVLLGGNLTRSIAAAGVGIAGLAISMLLVGAGFVALFVTTVAALVLAMIQLFGWMLVDVDRDHLPSTDRMTWIARALAFLLLGGGLVLLIWALLSQGGLASPPMVVPSAEPESIGMLLFGPWRDLATLCGLALSGCLLATLMLLREDGENR